MSGNTYRHAYPGPYAGAHAPWLAVSPPNNHQLGPASGVARTAAYPALSHSQTSPFHDPRTSPAPSHQDPRWNGLAYTIERHTAPREMNSTPAAPPVPTAQRRSRLSSSVSYAQRLYASALPKPPKSPKPPQHSHTFDALPSPPPPPPPPAFRHGQGARRHVYPRRTDREVENLSHAFASESFLVSSPPHVPVDQKRDRYLGSLPDDPDRYMAVHSMKAASFGHLPTSDYASQIPPEDVPQYRASASPRGVSSAAAGVMEHVAPLVQSGSSRAADIPVYETLSSERRISPLGSTTDVPARVTECTSPTLDDSTAIPQSTPAPPPEPFDPASDAFEPSESAQEDVPPYSLVDETSPSVEGAPSDAGVHVQPSTPGEPPSDAPSYTATVLTPLSPVRSQHSSRSPVSPADSRSQRALVSPSGHLEAPSRLPSPSSPRTSPSSASPFSTDLYGSAYGRRPRTSPGGGRPAGPFTSSSFRPR